MSVKPYKLKSIANTEDYTPEKAEEEALKTIKSGISAAKGGGFRGVLGRVIPTKNALIEIRVIGLGK